MADTQLILKTLVEGTAEARKSLDNVTKGLDEMAGQTKKVDTLSESLNKNAAGFVAIGVAAGAAFYGIVRGSNGAIDAATKQQNALIGLKSIVDGTGNSFTNAEAFIKNFTADGLVPMGDAATSLKNLLSRGYGLQEASVIMDRFKDSASFGRQSSLELGEAIRGATEGLKNENSILVDNAGVTKNVSMMWKEYADSINVGVGSLTLAQKREAEYQGILKETQFQVGDAAKLQDSYAGSVARAGAAQTKFSVALGTTLQPAKQAFFEAITPMIEGLTKFIETNPKVTATITILAGALTGLITGIAAVALAIGPMTAAWGALSTLWTAVLVPAGAVLIGALGAISAPVWIVIGVIAALIAAGVALYQNWDVVKAKAIMIWNEIVAKFFYVYDRLKFIWEAIKLAVQLAVIAMGVIINTALEAISLAWNNMWSGLGGAVTMAWEFAKNVVKQSVNWIIEKVNSVINAINSIASAGRSFGISAPTIPNIPRLAEGGIVTKPTLAMIGEGGESEAVIPLSKMNKMGVGGGVTINITGTFGQGVAEELGDYIVSKLARASYI